MKRRYAASRAQGEDRGAAHRPLAAAVSASVGHASESLQSSARVLVQGRQLRDRFGTAIRGPEASPRTNGRTGLPGQLKDGIERLSGMAMDQVRVHHNSSEPAQLNAHAFTQGTDIHIAPGQQRHLPHEAWHVVQQAQGRVRPTSRVRGVPINDDPGLEREADVMGEKAGRLGDSRTAAPRAGD